MNPHATLIIGLLLFLGPHSLRVFADGWRGRTIARVGGLAWKAGFAMVSLLGFYLIVRGYGAARLVPVPLWSPPVWIRHLVALFTLPAFVLAVAAYVPRNHLKRIVGHPLLAGTKAWALAHLLANGTLAALLLFGSFLIWALLTFNASWRRDRAAGVAYPAGTLAGSSATLLLGMALWAVFSFKLHGLLIGVRPFG